MGAGLGACAVKYGRVIRGCCIREGACRLVGEEPLLDVKVSERQVTKFFPSYLHLSVLDPETGSAIQTVSLGWHKGQRALTPQPLAGRETFAQYLTNTVRTLEALKRFIHEHSKNQSKATEETGKIENTLKQLGACAELLKRTLEGIKSGTHPFTGAMGLPTGHHGTYADDVWRAFYLLARTACESNVLRLNGIGYSAKANPLIMKRKHSYDVLTFIAQKDYLIFKGNWAKDEMYNLINWMKKKLGAKIVPNY